MSRYASKRVLRETVGSSADWNHFARRNKILDAVNLGQGFCDFVPPKVSQLLQVSVFVCATCVCVCDLGKPRLRWVSPTTPIRWPRAVLSQEGLADTFASNPLNQYSDSRGLPALRVGMATVAPARRRRRASFILWC